MNVYELNKEEESRNKNWYTTTFEIPVSLGKSLKEFANKHGFRGMNQVVIISCINHIGNDKKIEENNALIRKLLEEGRITKEEAEKLWM